MITFNKKFKMNKSILFGIQTPNISKGEVFLR